MKRSEFTQAVFEKIGAYVNAPRVIFGVAWASYEDTQAANNPWATTEPWEGATDFNSVEVKNYKTIEDGIDATVATLLNGDYTKLVDALKSDTSTVMQIENALNESPWGSKVVPVLYDTVRRNYAHFDKEVPDSGTVVEPPKEEFPPVPTPEEKGQIELDKSKYVELPTLTLNSSGKAVTLASVWLAYLSKNVTKVTSDFDAEFENKIKEYQKEYGLTVDGIIGPETWASFFV